MDLNPASARAAATVLFLAVLAGSICTPSATANDPSREYRLHERIALPGYAKRPYDIYIPDGLKRPAPALLVLHGGGSDAVNANRVTCPDGDVAHRDCITSHAARNGYIVVIPRGTSRRFLKRMRTWNAGGGDLAGQWICTSGLACENEVDDIAYFNVLLDTLSAGDLVDMQRVYATGISNGAAMAHRLACDMPHRIAAIVAVAGANQVSAVQGCAPDRPIPVLQIHGTADCAWPYDGGPPSCKGIWGFDGAYIAVEQSMQVWRDINGCSEKVTAGGMTDRFDDGTQVTRLDWLDCKAPLVGYRINGGGHTWPNGFQYRSAARIGAVTRELTNDNIWGFLSAHKLP